MRWWGGVGDRLARRPAAGVEPDQGVVTQDPDLVVGGGRGHEPADRARVRGVVVAVDTDVVVAGEADSVVQTHDGRQGWQVEHRGPIRGPAFGGAGPEGADTALVGVGGQPVSDLGVEVGGAGEDPAGQEGRFEVAVAAFDQALELRVAGRGEVEADTQRAGERGGLGRGFAGAADRGFPIPHQRSRHAPPLGEDVPHAGQDVAGLAGTDHHRTGVAGVAAGHGQHRQDPFGAVADGDGCGGEPQVALGEFAGLVGDPVGGVRWLEVRPQDADAVLEDRHGVAPTDAFGDHRRRHRRVLRQELTNLCLERVDQRPGRWAVVLGWPVGLERGGDGVAGDAQMAGDGGLREALSTVQPTDLGPILHSDHP